MVERLNMGSTRSSARKLLASLTALSGLVLGAGITTSVAAPATTKECRPSIAGLSLQASSIPQLQKALDEGRTSSKALVQTYLARIRAYDRHVNAIRALNPDALRIARKLDSERTAGRVRGPLHGIPILLKDNINTTDMPTTAGSIALDGSIPLNEATITTKLEAAGAIILGKTNLSEFANWVDLSMPNGYSSLGGQVRNPYTLGDPSGSSSGSGVAGSDGVRDRHRRHETSGSILSPSAANSLVGIKPTTGLLSRYGILPLAPSFDTPGPMTRTVTDAALLLGAMAGVDPKDARTADSTRRAVGLHEVPRRLGLEGRAARVQPKRQRLVVRRRARSAREQGATLVETDNLSNTSLVGLTEIAEIPNEFKASLNTYLAEQTPTHCGSGRSATSWPTTRSTPTR